MLKSPQCPESVLRWLFTSVKVELLSPWASLYLNSASIVQQTRTLSHSHPSCAHLPSELRARTCETVPVSFRVSNSPVTHAWMPYRNAAVRISCLAPFSGLNFPELPILSLSDLQQCQDPERPEPVQPGQNSLATRTSQHPLGTLVVNERCLQKSLVKQTSASFWVITVERFEDLCISQSTRGAPGLYISTSAQASRTSAMITLRPQQRLYRQLLNHFPRKKAGMP
jgi:hypothetical protein